MVPIETRGYGSALRGGIAAARGTYMLMGDADASYDFSQLPLFLKKLREGFDFVMGNRFKGGILPGAMPPLHRYLGTPVLTAIGKLFFKSPIGDFQCGLRAFRNVCKNRGITLMRRDSFRAAESLYAPFANQWYESTENLRCKAEAKCQSPGNEPEFE